MPCELYRDKLMPIFIPVLIRTQDMFPLLLRFLRDVSNIIPVLNTMMGYDPREGFAIRRRTGSGEGHDRNSPQTGANMPHQIVCDPNGTSETEMPETLGLDVRLNRIIGGDRPQLAETSYHEV